MTLPLAEAAVEDLRHAHRELLGVVDSLSATDWERFVPYGEWTVKDLIAHAIGDMSPSGAGLIHAGVLTPEFIAATSKGFDVRARNASIVNKAWLTPPSAQRPTSTTGKANRSIRSRISSRSVSGTKRPPAPSTNTER